jgi:alpha,alpha-trehalase
MAGPGFPLQLQPHHVLLLLLVLPCLLPCLRATTEMARAATAGSDEGASALLGLLQRVQSEALRALGPHDFDPKFYVDLPLATDERAADAALAALPRPAPTRAELDDFLSRYFGDPGSDLVPAVPPDFQAEPRGFLPRVHSPEARAWAREVHALWKQLARRVAPDVAARPDRHTLLPLPGGVVVPGSRFREVYYWDSYWVVRYLL